MGERRDKYRIFVMKTVGIYSLGACDENES
jgi:hypothetical protein